MRLVLAALLLLAACGKKGSPEPAWPKSQEPESWEEDGGESIDPVRETGVEASETDVDEDAAVAVDAGAADAEKSEASPTSIDEKEEMIFDDDGEDPPKPED